MPIKCGDVSLVADVGSDHSCNMTMPPQDSNAHVAGPLNAS